MRPYHAALCAAAIAAASSVAFAVEQVEILDTQESSFTNSACERSGSCSLKSFSMKVDLFRVNLRPDPAFLRRITVKYETDAVDNLEQYGVAQFIRGCLFDSTPDGRLSEREQLSHERYFYGQVVPFKHPTWVIDGIVADPLSWGDKPNRSRHYYYVDGVTPGTTMAEKITYYGVRKPAQPVLYLQDRPGGTAFYETNKSQAKNVSLEGKTCIYKSSDVPTNVAPEDVNFATPIHCFEWKNNLIYNFSKQTMESPPEIQPICLK
jgi:hypothetical protein